MSYYHRTDGETLAQDLWDLRNPISLDCNIKMLKNNLDWQIVEMQRQVSLKTREN